MPRRISFIARQAGLHGGHEARPLVGIPCLVHSGEWKSGFPLSIRHRAEGIRVFGHVRKEEFSQVVGIGIELIVESIEQVLAFLA